MAGRLRRMFGRRRPGEGQAGLDRSATKQDLAHLRDFSATRRGVELYVEPQTFATETTVVAIAFDGEWTRRRVDSPAVAADLARSLSIPLYRAEVTGYPQRMRDWSSRNPDRRLR